MMCQLNGGTAVITLALPVNTALVEYYAHMVLNQSGEDVTHFTTIQIMQAAEQALQQRFGDLTEDSDSFLSRFASDERFMQARGGVT